MDLNQGYNELAVVNGLPTTVIPASLYPEEIRKKTKPQKLNIVQEDETPVQSSKDKNNKRERPRSVSSTSRPTPSAKKSEFVFPSPEIQQDSDEEDEIHIGYTFIERRGKDRVSLSSRIEINQKWMQT